MGAGFGSASATEVEGGGEGGRGGVRAIGDADVFAAALRAGSAIEPVTVGEET